MKRLILFVVCAVLVPYIAFADYCQCLFGIHGQAEMACQAVAAAAWYYAQGDMGMYQRTGDLVHRAVTTYCNYYIDVVTYCLGGNLGSMTLALSIAYLGIEAVWGHVFVYSCHNPGLVLCTGNGVNDKPYFILVAHIMRMCNTLSLSAKVYK